MAPLFTLIMVLGFTQAGATTIRLDFATLEKCEAARVALYESIHGEAAKAKRAIEGTQLNWPVRVQACLETT